MARIPGADHESHLSRNYWAEELGHVTHFQRPQLNQTGAVWDEGCIRDRARDLFKVAKQVWPHASA